MTKIYIDTNVFLGIYRANLPADISKLMKFIKTNSKYLILTSQTKDEFARNRVKVLKKLLEDFTKKAPDTVNSNFIRSLPHYDGFNRSLKDYSNQRKLVACDIQEKIDNYKKDDVYKKISGIFTNKTMLAVNSDIIQRAHYRKLAGNPPTSNKTTCGDEIIWETLLAYGVKEHNDLIIVSDDHTFSDDAEFLEQEYRLKTGGELYIFKDIVSAYKKIGVNITDDIYEANQNLKWLDIIVEAFESLGGTATLQEIYAKAEEIIVYNDLTKKQNNQEKAATIRGILQRFSSDSSSFKLDNKDVFHQVDDGIWELR